MATAEQIRANRENAKKSTGPRRTDATRFNGLTHGLRAEHVVLPGESEEAFEAERQGWIDDWRPMTHTRAVLVERATVASWKLRRASRVEATRLYEIAADVAHDFDTERRVLVESALHNLPRDPAFSLSRLRSDVAGLDCLIGLWDDLARAVEAGWTSRQDHHDRLLNLLGHKTGSDPGGPEADASLALLRGPDPAAAATLRAVCAGRLAEVREERSKYCDLPLFRRRLIDQAIAPTSKEAQLLHRYEREHEKALHAAIRGLQALEKSGADLPEPPTEPETAPEAVAAAPAGQGASEKTDSSPVKENTSGKLASVGAAAPAGERPVVSAGPTGRPRGPIGAPSGPDKAPMRR
jgi:hypothetical protein